MSKLEVRSEKMIKKPAHDVFKALSRGLLFMNCGADSGSLDIDFKVGGKYKIDFKNYEVTNLGEFLEIVPDKKIVFTWCSTFDQPLTPDTKITIELFADGDKTRLLLVHSGFKTEASRKDHQGGWDAGLNDFTNELDQGKLRMVRVYSAPISKLFAVCKEDLVKGEIIENVADKKIVFKVDASQITLSFDSEDDGGSSVELIQDHVNTEKLQKDFRLNWEKLTEKMSSKLN